MLAVHHLLHCSVRTVCLYGIRAFVFINCCRVIQNDKFDVFAISDSFFAFIFANLKLALNIFALVI